MNSIVRKSKPIISWKIDEQTAGSLRAAVEDFRPVIICFTPESKDRCSGVTCEFRKVGMGEVHFTRDPLSGDFKFEVVGPRKPLYPEEFMVWFAPIEGLAQEVMIRLYWNAKAFIIAGNEIIVDEFSNVSWVVRDEVSIAVTDFELT